MNTSNISKTLPAILAATGLLAGISPVSAQVAPAPPTTIPSPLTLQDAIKIALAHQPQQFIADTQKNQAAGAITQAESQYFPTITPSYTYDILSSAKFAPEEGSINDVSKGGVGEVAGMGTLFDTGKRELVNAQARRQKDQAVFNAVNTRQTVIDTVTEDYYNLLMDTDLVTVAQAQVNSSQTVVDQVQAEVDAGTVAKASIYQAKATLANNQVTLLQGQVSVKNASAALKNELGVETTDVISPAPLGTENPAAATDKGLVGLPGPPPPPETKTLQQYFEIAWSSRPDLKQQQAVVEQDSEAVKIAELAATLQVGGTYSDTYIATDAFGPTGNDAELMLSASYPLFDAGNLRAGVRIAQAQRDAAKDQLLAQREAVDQAVEQAFNTRSQAYDSLTLAQDAVAAGQVNYESEVAQQHEGLATIVDVVTAQATLAQAQEQYVSTVYNFYIADSALRRAIGMTDTTP